MYLDMSSDRTEYTWMIKNAVVPRPIAWVGTQSPDGVGNLAPFSYFCLVAMDPPMLMVSFTGHKDTLDNIRAGGEFVVNLVTDGLAALQTDSAAVLPADVDEADLLGLSIEPGVAVKVPRLAAAKAALECRAVEEKALPGTVLVFAEVVGVHVDDRVLDERGRIDIAAYRPVGRLGGALYTTISDAYRIPVPAAADVLAGRRSTEQAETRAERSTGVPVADLRPGR